VPTDQWTYVLVRERRATYRVTRASGQNSCGDIDAGDTGFTVVPPALVGLWTVVLRDGWSWPRLVDSSTGTRTYTFTSNVDASVVPAYCSDDFDCTMRYRGATVSGAPFATTSAAELIAHATR
jgi:hypothetical protein